ncbi:hypothetical protein B566_EDAN010999 [Ephemera danica]|nr:hypothetical protein B566_EDAN010999 [Ephemera danica]
MTACSPAPPPLLPPGEVPGALQVREAGRALKVQHGDGPHLISLGGGRLSTAVTLHPLPEGPKMDHEAKSRVMRNKCIQMLFVISTYKKLSFTIAFEISQLPRGYYIYDV